MTRNEYLRNRVAIALRRHLRHGTQATGYWLTAWVRLQSRHEAIELHTRVTRLQRRIARLQRYGRMS